MEDSLINRYSAFLDKPIPSEEKEITNFKNSNGENFTRIELWLFRILGSFSGDNLYLGDAESEKYTDGSANFDIFCELIQNMTYPNSPHIFRVNNDLINLLLKTDTEIGYRPLPFNKVFIDGEIALSNAISIYGLFLEDAGDMIEVLGLMKIKKTDSFNILLPYFNIIKKGHKGVLYGKHIEESVPENLSEIVNNFVCSFLDFLNVPEVEYVTNNYSQESQLKRIERGKFPRASNSFIKLTGKTKIYIDNLFNENNGKIDFSHKFWVRGHFRNLDSERYTKKRKLKIWIHPFIKGKGLLIKKEYEVT